MWIHDIQCTDSPVITQKAVKPGISETVQIHQTQNIKIDIEKSQGNETISISH